MVHSFLMVLLVQGLFLHSPAVLSLPNPDSSFSSSSSSSISPTPTPTPTPTVHTITFYMPSPFSETIFGMLYTGASIATVSPIETDRRSAGADYTMYVEERMVHVPFVTTLPPDFEGSPSATMNPYPSTVTGTLISNGDSWHFKTSDNSFMRYFYEDCKLTDSNAVIQLSPSSEKIGLSCDIHGFALSIFPFGFVDRRSIVYLNIHLQLGLLGSEPKQPPSKKVLSRQSTDL
ncbi:hypothetical protein K435DRAFT_866584 [Dendrothele bispora CBS 962.96]|uniref:Uncharacterized protein n=1 Tax=Dendrothele bispora (strain CBS 962.96) TaxID=1314807 RepID=A0A4S8LH12_DENBC|nr:hypothetical protein K435DRAFT_866584 [Dendrothele bispora CBS 962.96]